MIFICCSNFVSAYADIFVCFFLKTFLLKNVSPLKVIVLSINNFYRSFQQGINQLWSLMTKTWVTLTKASGCQQKMNSFSSSKMTFPDIMATVMQFPSNFHVWIKLLNLRVFCGHLVSKRCIALLSNYAFPYHLRLESPTRSLSMDAPKGVHVKALAGNVDVTAHFNILLHSTTGLVSTPVCDFQTLI